VEPASCAIHGLDKLNPPVGVEALIFGAGPTGEFHTLHSDNLIDYDVFFPFRNYLSTAFEVEWSF
jgi:hypothetical protein